MYSYMSYVICHMSCVICHIYIYMSYIYMSYIYMSYIYMSYVICHMSYVYVYMYISLYVYIYICIYIIYVYIYTIHICTSTSNIFRGFDQRRFRIYRLNVVQVTTCSHPICGWFVCKKDWWCPLYSVGSLLVFTRKLQWGKETCRKHWLFS